LFRNILKLVIKKNIVNFLNMLLITLNELINWKSEYFNGQKQILLAMKYYLDKNRIVGCHSNKTLIKLEIIHEIVFIIEICLFIATWFRMANLLRDIEEINVIIGWNVNEELKSGTRKVFVWNNSNNLRKSNSILKDYGYPQIQFFFKKFCSFQMQ